MFYYITFFDICVYKRALFNKVLTQKFRRFEERKQLHYMLRNLKQ
jgi:hypothetical protein